jgi:predicted N-acetyltransferase YhbS
MISGRSLSRNEIEKIWSDINRSELIDGVYHLEDGALQLRPVHHDLAGWPLGEAEQYGPILESCHDRGGWFHGLFDDDRLIGIAVVESEFIGRNGEQVQLKFLHVSRPYRSQGLGQQLFGLAKAEAAKRGAKSLYVSATRSKHTIDFYRQQGCTLATEPDPALFELEPEDIHLDCVIE